MVNAGQFVLRRLQWNREKLLAIPSQIVFNK